MVGGEKHRIPKIGDFEFERNLETKAQGLVRVGNYKLTTQINITG